MNTLLSLLVLLPLLQADEEPNPTAPLFVEHCAQCHGEKGDGDGWAELDRRARSFQEGGFSYGNTPETIFRTITMGIPGTPMPAFDGTLDEDQRTALAAYVIELGPEIREVSRSETILRVHDRPQWVRGHLPPIADGASAQVRGLLLGLPDGLAFEFRGDDVRLLGVRAGEFVERTDWTGRGGTPLKPLGQVIWLNEGGDPGPSFFRETKEGERVAQGCRLVATRGDRLVYDLLEDGAPSGIRVEEGFGALVTAEASGFRRSIHVEWTGSLKPTARGGEFRITLPRQEGELVEELEAGGRRWRVLRTEGGKHLVTNVPAEDELVLWSPGNATVLGPGIHLDTELAVLLPGIWDADVRARLIEELNR